MSDSKSQIVHFNYRFTKGNNPRFFYVNLILKPHEEWFKEWCKFCTEEHRKINYYEDIAEYEKYTEGLQWGWDFTEEEWGDEKSCLRSTYPDPCKYGYIRNYYQKMIYIEKFDVYRFTEYFTNNPITRGAVDIILDLQHNNEPYYSYGSWENELSRAIETLNLHWD
jgi:hypothetical protein